MRHVFCVLLQLMLLTVSKSFFMRSLSSTTGNVRAALRLNMMARKKKEMPANPIAVVTGASRGIGRAIAIALGDAGCKVIVNYASSESSALEVCEEIKTRAGEKGALGVPMKANCGSVEEVQAMFAKINEEVGPVDILVNNAGITKDMLTMMMKPSDFTDVIDLNLNGVFFCSQAAFMGSMMGQKRGRIINIASIVGQIGNPGQANYAAAKGGVIGMTKALAKEFGGRNICVNAVCPGFIESDMTKELNKEAILPSIPLKRFGTPEEVAGLVKFLATDPAAAYMTGHCFNVDGGLAIGAT
mmetsp:Transcript_21809/g.30012  ORF Transcript_21809/g.30012 Transcript_21809/m.30012 type:complete len:300 (-) Transcript_21809:67-966(-)